MYFISIIIVNCVILGRCEAFASKNSISRSLLDALGMGVGFTWGLFLLGGLREFFGAGTIFGIMVMPKAYDPLIVMILPAGAFLVLGFLVAIMNRIS